ncbi:deoxyuridine 5'-triphosphate nucleotidohydrolase [Kineococcus rhizosphaerae]|uniref:Deoxyuridine 5'-triphosphate nucleotidohydrolase n=1 Tax=Kineococcus rhizosphaerae TaxID=559628 RepID=A0A2T0RB86_9ACTN|nr:dUTP diphosphatase [Kineococcus rhizosphaerae]PRY18400.1 deoxyuridine 5'-triphosphate nucleotidohydrolase [Kineococcus rhizosphaerae]
MTELPPPTATLPVETVLSVPEALPTYAHPGDAGADLTTRVDVVVGPGERVNVPTGVSIALPEGYAAFVVPRSGLAARRGLTTLNAPGTVDAGYRGEIRVTLHNTDLHEAVDLKAGDRIAQLVVQRVERVRFVPVQELPGSVRGAGGHGSTGGSGALHPAPQPQTPAQTSAQTVEERP